MAKFPDRERPAESSNARSHEVPCTIESGCFEHLDKINREYAEKNYAAEEARIQAAFQNSSERLQNAQDIAHGVAKEHVGWESDSETPKVPEFDNDGHVTYREK